MNYLPYALQSIDASDREAVSLAIQSPMITRSSLVEQFEQVLADYCGSTYAVAFSSGTAALMAAYHAAQVNAFDRLVSTPNTFVATVGAAMQCQAEPLLIDLDRSSGGFSLNHLEEIFKNYRATRGRLIIAPVHFSGIAMDMELLNSKICHPDTVVIEDAAHALGSFYPRGGPKVGSCTWSDMTIFSFHPAKILTTGEGGMVTTNDPELNRKLRLFRNNGIEREASRFEKEERPGPEIFPGYYEVKELTGNYHLTEFQAALGLSQLKRLGNFIKKRRELVGHYRKRLSGIKRIKLFDERFDSDTAYHLFVAQIDFKAFGTTRKQVMEKLQESEIGSQVHYIPVYRFPFFKKTRGDLSEYFPEMEKYYEEALSLPLYFDLSKNDVDRVCDALLASLG